MRYLALLAILSGALFTVAGCGQKGALYLPGEPVNEPSQQQTEPEQ